MTVEEWRDVVGYEGLYEASSLGNIRRVQKSLKPAPDGNGRLRVTLSVNGTTKSVSVPKLVSAAFLGPRPVKYEVNHIDGDPRNNAVDNLEYLTSSDNKKHAIRLGLMKPPALAGADHPRVRLSPEQVLEIRHLRSLGASYGSIAKVAGVSKAHVKSICQGKAWACLKDGDTHGAVPTKRGSELPQARLTEDIVRAIRDEYRVRTVGRTMQALAAKYGVGLMTIRDVIARKSWAHI